MVEYRRWNRDGWWYNVGVLMEMAGGGSVGRGGW